MTELLTTSLAAELFDSIKDLPIISLHGHCDPRWFLDNQSFSNATEVFLTPDHYWLRLFHAHGIEPFVFGRNKIGQTVTEYDPEHAWQIFARNQRYVWGTTSALWFQHSLKSMFGIEEELNSASAAHIFSAINSQLQSPEFKPRELLKRMKIVSLATTDAATDSLDAHKQLAQLDLETRIIPTFRPDAIINPLHAQFRASLTQLAEMTGLDTERYTDYLMAIRKRRQAFRQAGATATDHGPRSPKTVRLSDDAAEALFDKLIELEEPITESDAQLWEAHMLVKMAEMSADDGLVMQLHPGSYRNYDDQLYRHYGPDIGADIPLPISLIEALKPLLDRMGDSPLFQMVLYTLDETTYARELAPLAGYASNIFLGSPWWFHDSPHGMQRFFNQTVETTGFYKLAGFTDDTRAIFSIATRHRLARIMLAEFLAFWVQTKRLSLNQAHQIGYDYVMELPQRAYSPRL